MLNQKAQKKTVVNQMAMLNFDMDLQKQDNFSKAFTARQGDAGEQFSVTLFDNQVPYVPVSGDVVSLRVVTPSGKFASVTGTMSGNKATFTLNGQITSETGYYQRAYVAVSNGTNLRTTQDLIFFSLGNSDINKGQADYYVAELDNLLQQLNEEFDEWLAEREQDYSDLLARIVALTNRVTGLETKLDDIIAQLQSNMINTTNVLDTSLLLAPESNLRRRVGGGSFEATSWGSLLFGVDQVNQMFKPSTTYHVKYTVELLTLNGGAIFANSRAHGGMNLYSSVSTTTYPPIWIGQGEIDDFKDLKVGDRIEREVTFTTPNEATWNAAKYQILAYSRHDVNGIIDSVRFIDVMIQEGSMFTGFQNDPDNTLTKYDKYRLKQNLHPDPLMTGTVPIKTKDSAVNLDWTTNGWLDVKNTDTANIRRFWYDPISDLNIPQENGTRPLSVSLKIQLNNGASITVGYASGENITYTSTSSTAWVWVTGIVKSTSSTGFLSVYLSPNANLKIQQFDIYYAEITNSSAQLNQIADIAKNTIGTPDTIVGTDANTLFNSGVWIIQGGVNMPPATSTQYFYLRVINFNANNCIQFASLREGAGVPSNPNYVRQCVNGNWQEWRFISTLLNDKRVDNYGVDFDTLKETGVFVNTSATNSPDGATSTSWYVEVIKYGSSGNYVYQRATKISDVYQETYERQLFNGTWSAWRRLSAPYIDIVLATSSDANTITTTQNIQVEATSTANLPTSGVGVFYYLEVIARADQYVMQRATLRGSTFKVYVRQLHKGTWTGWREIAFV